MVQTAPGIVAPAGGVVDTYSQTDEMHNGMPVWRGVSHGYVAYMCGGQWAGRWMFTQGSKYEMNRGSCRGEMTLLPSGKWQANAGQSWIDSTPTISCGRSC